MQVVRDVASLRAAVSAARAHGQRVGFVPTMGALHAGHLSLIERARAECECVVLSIFVNPLQFAPTEDLAKYPRTEEADLAAAAPRGATLAFVPPVDVMYPGTRAISVVPDSIADRWEGAIRPGHFAGVLTVVSKLFNLVQPDLAVFGQKDLQQATLIRALVRDLDFPITLDIAPIVREADGLAMSSRNRYLDGDQRRAAGVLSQALATIAGAHAAGITDAAALVSRGDARLRTEDGVRADYLSIVDPRRLEPVSTASVGDFVIVAARVGQTRLLDNHRLGDPLPLSS
ncbi:MAG: pantoate--beta-alanine ligase [Gemmatimonadota bacterium]